MAVATHIAYLNITTHFAYCQRILRILLYNFFMNEFNIILKQLRNNSKLTQKQISKKLGISITGYAGYEQGIREPDLKMLKKIADFFDVTIDYLVGRENY